MCGWFAFCTSSSTQAVRRSNPWPSCQAMRTVRQERARIPLAYRGSPSILDFPSRMRSAAPSVNLGHRKTGWPGLHRAALPARAVAAVQCVQLATSWSIAASTLSAAAIHTRTAVTTAIRAPKWRARRRAVFVIRPSSFCGGRRMRAPSVG